ncbi:hypothetical protein ACFOYU_11735 [Microvirga sp. GCM10011540]|uniref:hypothetical protein n=1 Tax=Microvirga sp. GCM10011540 TaxID=3317338 RepID=UPI0036150C4B
MTALLASPLARRLLGAGLLVVAAAAAWLYVAGLRRSLVEAQAAAIVAEGKLAGAEALLILQDSQHKAVLDAVARERLQADERERAMADAHARLERVPVDPACPGTPAVIDEALDILGSKP